MNDPFEPDPAAEAREEATIEDAEETVDALPVLAGPPRIVGASPRGLASQRRAVAMIPAVQAAAVAAGGFVAGAAVLGLVHRRQRRSSALTRGRRAGRDLARHGARGGSRGGDLVQIVGSRSLLLDVHLLGGGRTER